jgi:hypothetical protein
MLRGMSARHFDEWQIYGELEPWGEIRQDLRFAHVVSTLVNLQRDTKKRPEPIPLTQFLLKFDDDGKDPAPPQAVKSAEQIRQMLKTLTAVHNEGRSKNRQAVPRRRHPAPLPLDPAPATAAATGP